MNDSDAGSTEKRERRKTIRGRCYTVSGVSQAEVAQIIEGCLHDASFESHVVELDGATKLIHSKQRAHWHLVLLQGLPQRYVFKLHVEQDQESLQLTYDEQLATWYLLVLVALAALFTPIWVDAITMLFRSMSMPPYHADFRPALFWLSALAVIIFVRLMLASGAGTTIALVEELRHRLRAAGATVDQDQGGTIVTKLLVALLFVGHLVSVAFLTTFVALRDCLSGNTVSASVTVVVAGLCILTVLVVGVLLVSGSYRTVRPAGGEERQAVLVTGVTLQVAMVVVLIVHFQFLVLGTTTDEFWALVFRVTRFVHMDAGQIHAAGLEHVSRANAELGLSLIRNFGSVVFNGSLALLAFAMLMTLMSIRRATHVRRMCERVHHDIATQYGRTVASGVQFRSGAGKSFFLAWILIAVVLTIGVASVLRVAVSCFEFGYAGRAFGVSVGPVEALANGINVMLGAGFQSSLGPWFSRLFFVVWAVLLVAPICAMLLSQFFKSRRYGLELRRLSELPPKDSQGLNQDLATMASSSGVSVGLAISPDCHARASAHRLRLGKARNFIELSARCLTMLNAEERRALVAHELSHHVLGHCRKHNLMQWLGCVTYVGGAYITSMEDSFGFEMQADRFAVERFGVDPDILRQCLLKMHADAVMHQVRRATTGLSLLHAHDTPSRNQVSRTIGFPGWEAAIRDFWELLRADAEVAYWHPSVGERVAALREMSR